MKTFIGTTILLAALMTGCGENRTGVKTDKPEQTDTESFARGADVSWLTQMESEGARFYDNDGNAKECMALLKEHGVDAIRLRVWVNPADGWNSIDDVMVKARRAKALGMRIMIDFHYSDTWADPGKQTIPTAWSTFDITAMCDAVAKHTADMMNALKSADITPEWVQVGNEVSDGMLWELGRASKNPQNFARMVNAGYNAVKAVFPDTQVIVHVDRGNELGRFTWLFDILRKNGGKFDMIGMSLYPTAENYESVTNSMIGNIKFLAKYYSVPVMVCEIGMHYSASAECKACLERIIAAAAQDDGKLCKGVFYWEPQATVGYNGGYDKGCFVNGRPTVALDAFKQ